MSLRTRLAQLFADHDLRLGPRGKIALGEFLAIVREEADSDEEDADDDDDADGAAGDDPDALEATRVIACPHCGESLTIALDLSGGDQDAIQDCEVCCSPIRIVVSVSDGRVTGFSAEQA